jgi:hypothetical protein
MTPEERMDIAGKTAYYESILDSYDALEEQREAEAQERREFDAEHMFGLKEPNYDVHFRAEQFHWKFPIQIIFKNEVIAKGSATSRPYIEARIIISELEKGKMEKAATIQDIFYAKGDKLISVVVKDLEVTNITWG